MKLAVSHIVPREPDRRETHNQNIIQALKSGKYIHSFNKLESRYPRRPKIEKDKDALDFGFRPKA